MDIPFKIILHQQLEHNSPPKVIEPANFVSDEKSLYNLTDNNVTSIVENKRLELEFLCEDESAQLYMDGLDTIPMRFLNLDDNDAVFLSPTREPIILYAPKEKSANNRDNRDNDEYYPFIPGYYRIKVTSEGVSYYSLLKVEPKQITEEQWVAMRNEVEETLNGLAQDLIIKNSSIGLDLSVPIPVHILRKLYIVKNDFSKWIVALKNIAANPRIRVGKEYTLLPKGKAARIDSASLRYRARHPEKQDFVYSPSNIRNYNLLENQWIKQISRFMVREMNALLKYLETHKSKVLAEIKDAQRYQRLNEESFQVRLKNRVLEELEDYDRFVKRVRSECIFLMQEEWIHEVDDTIPRSVPHAMLLDERYKMLYNMYRSLKKENFSVSLDSNYDFYWKRTDLLYEIWGFLQIINALQHESIGFEVVKGWIFNTSSNAKSIQVPFLEPGTVIEFKKDNIKLRVVYDEKVTFNEGKTTLYNPIYANNSNTRPDVRLDFYEGEEYIGSVIMDFKYRPLHYIWEHNKLYSPNDVMRQLISYRNNFDSTWIYKERFPGQFYRYRPINEVWAIYPKHEGNRITANPMRTHSIRLMELTPQDSKDEMYMGLREAISKVIGTKHPSL